MLRYNTERKGDVEVRKMEGECRRGRRRKDDMIIAVMYKLKQNFCKPSL